MKIMTDKNSEGKIINRVLYITLSLFIFTALILILSIIKSGFADWYNSSVGAFLRLAFSAITGFLPFSLAELCIIVAPLLIVAAISYSIVRIIKKNFNLRTFLKKLLIVFFIFTIIFINVFGVCYFASPLASRLELERKELSRQQLYEDALYTRTLLESASGNVNFDKSGASVNPHTFSETDSLIDKGYDALSQSGVYKSVMIGNSKPILLSKLMTYTHISGMYMPFTGEANVNTNYPDYVVAFTIAHEKAHQRGIASEDEANFMAFLACMASGDEYLEYAALMNMYDYFLDATFKQDEEMYNELVDKTPEVILKEMYAYYKFFEKYTNSAASVVAESVNDTYLKTMGKEDGVKSYGLVIELYHAYIQKEKAE